MKSIRIHLFIKKLVFAYSFSTQTEGIFKYAVKIYTDPLNQRKLIRDENKGKIGVYCWVNNINGKYYIGSGDPLYLRISDYFQGWYLSSRTRLYIVRALSKYGMANFSLIILEYSDSPDLIKCEQKWIDFLKPEYNLNPIAGNTKGYKHKAESRDKMRDSALGRRHTEEVKQIMSESRKGKNNPFYGKTHREESLILLRKAAVNRVKSPVPGIEVEIIDIETKLTHTFDSIRKAALFMNSDIKTILRREKMKNIKGSNTPYKKRYIIFIKRS